MSQRITESSLQSWRDPGSFLVRRIGYPAWARIATPGRKKYSNIFEKTGRISVDSMQRHQSTLLRALLLHAYRHVPFYRRSMEDAGITPLDIQTPEDLVRLPTLTRWYREHHQEDLMAHNPGKRLVKPTNGLSGNDNRHRAVEAALIDRYRENAGLYPWMQYASMGEREHSGAKRGRVGALVSFAERATGHRIQFDLSADRVEALNTYLKALRRYRPDHLLGTPELVSELAHYCLRNGIDDLRFKGVLLEEGTLSSESREVVESVFRTRVFLRYGCQSIPLIAWQCNAHAGFHVNEDAIILEIDPLRTSPSGHGSVLVTDLFNFTMPLIRFELGDVARWCEPTRCDCGLTLRRLASIEGSVAEHMARQIFKAPSGSRSAVALGPKGEDWTGEHLTDKSWMN